MQILTKSISDHPATYATYLALRSALPVLTHRIDEFKAIHLPRSWAELVAEESLAAAFTVYSRNVYLDSFGDRLLDLMVDHFKWINDTSPKKKIKVQYIEKLRTNQRLKEIGTKLEINQWMLAFDHEGKITSARKETPDVMEAVLAALFTNLDYQKTFQFLMSARQEEGEFRVSPLFDIDHFFNSKKGDYAKKEYHRVLRMLIRSIEEKPVFIKVTDTQFEFSDQEKINKRLILSFEPEIMKKINGYSSHFDRIQRYGFQQTWNEFSQKQNEIRDLLKTYQHHPAIVGEKVNELVHDTLLSLGTTAD